MAILASKTPKQSLTDKLFPRDTAQKAKTNAENKEGVACDSKGLPHVGTPATDHLFKAPQNLT